MNPLEKAVRDHFAKQDPANLVTAWVLIAHRLPEEGEGTTVWVTPSGQHSYESRGILLEAFASEWNITRAIPRKP